MHTQFYPFKSDVYMDPRRGGTAVVLEDDPNEALSRFSDEKEQEILDHHGSESNSEELVEEDSLQCRRLSAR